MSEQMGFEPQPVEVEGDTEKAPHRHAKPRPTVSPWLGILLLALAVGVTLWAFEYGATKKDNSALTTNVEALAAGVQQQCATGKPLYDNEGRNLCPVAKEAEKDPTTVVKAADGRGITGTEIVNGYMMVKYSDGAVEQVGKVQGNDGKDGDPGKDGRAITGTDIVAGEMILNFSDETSDNLGPVVGPAGVGIQDVRNVDGSLTIVLTNGQFINAGILPPGPAGPIGATGPEGPEGKQGVQGVQGFPGEPPFSWTKVDGATGAVIETCARSSNFDPAAPTYVCTGSAPAPQPTAAPTTEPTPTTATSKGNQP
ncbi:putative tail fiber protein [Arthrobacter phage vB_ArtM-ArV1]|uniref:Putative tail fiber protein n=1 Tax=Arthrobacter phage vB_ArtM-ArV1 TaxID=1566993 RepID=A0A0A7HAV6_9CAUD|nr:tail fiber protein [Arthrobacter phage vB_ArtM-ArV1]AIZ01713.1 putative tail fiber protein [Arthrobacter phage vB_ArtM-ArV1]